MLIPYSDQAARRAAITKGDSVIFRINGDGDLMTGTVFNVERGIIAIEFAGCHVACTPSELQLFHDSDDEDPDIVGPLTDVRGYCDDRNGVMEVMAMTKNGRDLRVAQLALGTGHFVWASKAFYEYYGTDEGEKKVEVMVERCKQRLLRLGERIVDKLQELSALNRKQRQLINELTEELDARYDLALADNMVDPLSGFTVEQLVHGTIEERDGKRYLICDGHRPAGENGTDGLFVWQTAGYCGDDYSGKQFVRIEGGKYLCLPFEF